MMYSLHSPITLTLIDGIALTRISTMYGDTECPVYPTVKRPWFNLDQDFLSEALAFGFSSSAPMLIRGVPSQLAMILPTCSCFLEWDDVTMLVKCDHGKPFSSSQSCKTFCVNNDLFIKFFSLLATSFISKPDGNLSCLDGKEDPLTELWWGPKYGFEAGQGVTLRLVLERCCISSSLMLRREGIISCQLALEDAFWVSLPDSVVPVRDAPLPLTFKGTTSLWKFCFWMQTSKSLHHTWHG